MTAGPQLISFGFRGLFRWLVQSGGLLKLKATCSLGLLMLIVGSHIVKTWFSAPGTRRMEAALTRESLNPKPWGF